MYRNVISQPCYSKGDCGGLRSFGSDNLSDTSVYDLSIRENIIVDSVGNTDGARSDFDSLFGFGLYIDNGSRNVTAQGNIIAGSTAAGILYQRSTGAVLNNILFDNTRTNSWGEQLSVGGSGAYLGTHTGNTLLGKHADTWTMSLQSTGVRGEFEQQRVLPCLTDESYKGGHRIYAGGLAVGFGEGRQLGGAGEW